MNPTRSYFPKLPAVTLSPTAEPFLAKGMHEVLVKQIKEFQEGLDDEHEVGACLTAFGREVLIHVTELAYQNPHLLIIIGADPTGTEVRLLQHINQVSLLLMPVPVEPGKAARRVGFHREDPK